LPIPAAAQSAPAIATATALRTSPRAEEEEVPVSDLFVVTAEKPLPRPPPPARASRSDDDDDDDDDAAFEPTFSLLNGLCEGGLAGASTEHAVEVIRFRHGCVTKLRHLRGGERLHLPGLRKAVGRSPRRGSFAFFSDALPENAAIRQAGQSIDDVLWRRRADKRGRVPLDPCTQVLLPLPSGEGVLIHLVPAAAPLPKAPARLKPTKVMLWIGGLSLLVHLVIFAVIGLTSLVRREYIVESKEGRFARIALKEIELEPPAAPPAREKKKAKPEPSENAPSETAPRVAVARIPRARTTPAPQASATAQKLLSALGSMSTGPKTSVATAMSNLDAVGPVRGGGFKVSGAIGKLPGDSLRLAAAGSGIGRIDTKSANDVGKNLGRVLARGPTGQVRAQVTTKPNTMKVEGHLDRGEIQRVINSHIHELQGCYERQLIVSPNLSGKVSFEWVIGTSGAVTSVKIKTSTLSSNEATSCMQAAIRRWQFPSPSGGSVTVIYPIALATSGT
jgi:cell division septation protein DedD